MTIPTRLLEPDNAPIVSTIISNPPKHFQVLIIFKPSQAFSGLHVSIDCKLKNGDMKRVAAGDLNDGGEFSVSLPKDVVSQDGKSLKHDCYAQLHSAAAIPCPSHDGVDASKLVLNNNNGVHVFSPTKTLRFSAALCTSKFLWPHFNYPPLPKSSHPWLKNYGHPWFKTYPPLPPFHKPFFPPIYKPPIVKPFPPIYKPPIVKPLPPPVPIYKPPVVKPLPPPVPIYKPPVVKPPVVKPNPPPVPVYKPPKKPCPPTKPKPPVVHKPPKAKPPVYKPPVVKPLPPPVPIYKPPVVKPLPPPVPIYKPPIVKPLPPPVPIYKPPFFKKPCPPLPPFPKIPHKYFKHPKFGGWPPLSPHP
ncbi:proline-rich protein 4-like isoform X2 [Andrographis paniculata]|uniref:proline-rich protein 4-like isoform X2 n=1 Tax=Andrographis paniculata TaxID=175694 RepID=UPI0021E8C140|nr:proline-rich protein 4-like isoform X2 [Andrographis paniculata]